MKNTMKKVSILVALVFVTAALLIPVSAEVKTTAGETVTVTLKFNAVYGIDGQLDFSNKALFSTVDISYDPVLDGSINDAGKVYLFGSEQVDLKLIVTATVSESAKPGDKCVVSFAGQSSDRDGHMTDTSVSETVVIESANPDSGDMALSAIAVVIAAVGASAVIAASKTVSDKRR